MFVSGRIWKEGKFWLIEVSTINVMTQGRSKKEAYHMMRDAVELLINRKGVKVEIFQISNGGFTLHINDDAVMVSLILKGQRAKHGLTLANMAKRLGSTSKNAYAQYEQGRSIPSLHKLQQLLSLMDPKAIISLNLIDEPVGHVA